jgi:predicted Zn-dependent peptidase
MLLRLEDTRAVSGWLGGQEILSGRVLTPEAVVRKIDAITTDDLMRVIGGLLARSQLNLAVVGPYKSEQTFLPLLDL